MAATAPTKIGKLHPNGNARLSSHFDRRFKKILVHATDVFYDKGYEGASMRDLSRTSGMSLAGMYYYFESKERLLYHIQKHTFSTIVRQLRERLEHEDSPEQRVRLFILNHLQYSLANPKAMKVLSHEDDVLKNGLGAEIAALKREYYGICVDLLQELKGAQGCESVTRAAVLSLFGMMNWIYTWYNPRVDGNAEELARQMGDIFLNGICRSGPASVMPKSSQSRRAKSNKADRLRRTAWQ
jgi:TetR/AcrR family transcriptional regulator, cholesterol catabolism regulator